MALRVVVSARLLAASSMILATAASALRAQQSPPVVPGIMLAIDAYAGPDTVVFRRTVTRQGVDSAAGTRTVVRRVVAGVAGTQLVEVEQRFPGGGGEIVDTAIAELRTFRAVAARSHQPARTMRFAFTGPDVEGSVTAMEPAAPGAPHVEQVHQSLGGPIFDSNVLELVVAALPLAPGFATELPLFIYERGGRVATPVAVRGRARVELPGLGAREAWVVSLDLPGAPATIWVDTRTRAVLRTRYDIAARGMSFTDDRVTPLGS